MKIRKIFLSLLVIFSIFLTSGNYAYATGSTFNIHGTITALNTGKPVPFDTFGIVCNLSRDSLTQVSTDANGFFSLDCQLPSDNFGIFPGGCWSNGQSPDSCSALRSFPVNGQSSIDASYVVKDSSSSMPPPINVPEYNPVTLILAFIASLGFILYLRRTPKYSRVNS